MKRKIKSSAEIGKEIRLLFNNAVSEKHLRFSIDNYLTNLTGKELISKEDIKKIISFEIVARHIFGGSDFSKKFILDYSTKRHRNLIRKLFESALIFNPNRKNINQEIFNELSKDLKISNVVYDFRYDELPLDIIKTCYDDINYIKEFQSDKVQLIKRISKSEKAFGLLNKLIEKDKEVSILLLDYVNRKKRKFIVQLVINRLIPLNAIFLYFNKNLNIKENTEKFYLMLNKKIPRNTIQLAIKRDLTNIKKGKFSVPAI